MWISRPTSPTVTKIDSAASKFGGTSLALRAANAYAYVNANGSALALGAGDWAIDFWVRLEDTFEGSDGALYDGRPGVTSGDYPTIYIATDRAVRFMNNNTNRFSPLMRGTHIAVTRVNGVTRMFLNGAQEGSNYSDGTTYVGSNLRPIIGANGFGQVGVGLTETGAWMDEVRVSIGSGRWSANFTPPAQAYSRSPTTLRLQNS